MIEQTDLMGTGSVNVGNVDDSFGDVSQIQTLQETFPELRGTNPFVLKKKFLEDDQLFNEFSEKFFTSPSPDEFAQLREQEPEMYNERLNNFRNNFRQDLNESSFVGQTEKESLVERSIDLSRGATSLPIEQYKNVIENNPDAYEEFGLLDGDGRIRFGEDSVSSATFGQSVLNNEKLHKQLEIDRYKQFENELSKSHNQTSKLRDDPTLMTQAYVAYNNYGPEGLTQFMNYVEWGDADESLGQRFQRGREAIDWLQESRLPELTREFVIGGEVRDVDYADEINETSFNYGVSPSLIGSILKTESNFNPDAVGADGEIGIAQIMPAFARDAGMTIPDELVELDKKRMNATGQDREELTKQLLQRTQELSTPENDDRWSKDLSIDAASRMLGQYLEEFDYDTNKAVAAYNAGAGRVRSAVRESERLNRPWQEFIPDSTRTTYMPLVEKNSEEFAGIESLVFRPLTPRKELTEDISEDFNAFTSIFKKDLSENKNSLSVYEELLNERLPESYQPFLNASSIRTYGEYSESDKELSWGVLERAINEDGFTVDDLMDTLMANAQYDTESRAVGGFSLSEMQAEFQDSPEGVYRFDYNNLPDSAKVAVNALYHHNEIGNMIRRTDEEGVYELIPTAYEDDWDWWKGIQNYLTPTRSVGRRQPDGTTEFEEVPEGGLLNRAWRAVAGTGLTAAHTLYKFAYEPAVRATALSMDKLDVGNTESSLSYSDAVRGRAQTSIFDVMTGDDEIGTGSMGLSMAGDMVQYMGAMFLGGRALLNVGSAGLSAMTGVKKSSDLINYGNHLFASPRVAGMSLKLSNAVKNKSPWASGFGVWYSGGALVEATQPSQASFYELIPEVLGYEQTNDVRKFYRMADSNTKTAMDIGASLVLDTFADNLVAGAKFLTARGAKSMWGRDKFKSLKYLEGEGKYDISNEPQYRSDFREFWHNFTSELDQMPTGNVGSDFSEAYFTKGGIKTLADFTKSFVDEASDVAGSVKGDVEDHIRWLNRHLGDGMMDDDAVQELTERSYQHFIDASTERLYGMLDTADSPTLVNRIADSLEQIPTRVREFKPEGEPVPINQFHKYRSKGHNIFIKEGKIYESNPDFWTVDLANALRARSGKETIESVTKRKLRDAGLDKEQLTPDELQRTNQIRTEVENNIGSSVRLQDGRVGYVTDFDDMTFTVRLEDGTTVRSKNPIRLTDEQAAELDGIAWNLNRQSELENQPRMLPPARSPESTPSGEAVTSMMHTLRRGPEIENELQSVQQQIRQANTSMRSMSRGGNMTPELEQRWRNVRSNLVARREELFEEAGQLRGSQYDNFLQTQIRSVEDDITHLRTLRENANVVDIAEPSPERGARVRSRQQQLDAEIERLQAQRNDLQRDLSIYQRDIGRYRPESDVEMSPRSTGHEMRSWIDRMVRDRADYDNIQAYQQKFRDAARKSYALSRQNNNRPFC